MEVNNYSYELSPPQLKQNKILQQEGNGKPMTYEATNYLFKGFRILGINMPSKDKPFYILYSLLINGLVTVWLPLSFAISYGNMSEKDLEISNLLTSIQVAINCLGCSVKIIYMAFLLPKLRSAAIYMEKLDERCRDTDEIAEVHKVVRLGNRLVVVFAISYWTYSTSTFLGAILRGRPPYAVYNPFFDWRKSTCQFWIAALTEYLLMDVTCFQEVAVDSYAAIYVCILRAHIKILLLRVKKLGSRSELSLEQNVEELKLCIKDHKNLIKLYEIISPIISITIFIQFMITAIMLGTTLSNIFIFSTELSSQVASCFYILAVVVEIFPLCYYAQCIVNDSEKLSQQIFYSNWIEQNSSYRKMLIFFMQRTQRTMELTAGKIFPITLNSFLSIAKFSFSLYTLIKKMGIKEKLA